MLLRVEFTIKGHDISVGEEARMWIDVDRSGSLADQEEVDLIKNDLVWTGTIESREASSKNMLFIVKYIASPGTAEWCLKVRSDAPQDHEVFSGGGKVSKLQSQVVGALRS